MRISFFGLSLPWGLSGHNAMIMTCALLSETINACGFNWTLDIKFQTSIMALIRAQYLKVKTTTMFSKIKSLFSKDKNREPQITRELYLELANLSKDKEAKGKRWTTTEEARPKIIEIIEKDVKKAIKIFRPYPPSPSQKETSFLGGLPIMPRGMEWPEGMNFLGQINLDDIPKNDTLPDNGILFFFAQLGDHSKEFPTIYDKKYRHSAARVLYAKKLPSNSKPCQPPSTIPNQLVSRPAAIQSLRDLKVFPKWAVKFVELDSFREKYSHSYHKKMADLFPGNYNTTTHEWENDF